MSPETKISLAIPTYNRFDLLLECFAQVLDDPRIGEIVISDDASNDGSWEKIRSIFGGQLKYLKVVYRRNEKNLDCYRNKMEAVKACSNDWVILFDDDNVITPAYLDALFRWQTDTWEKYTAYLPEFAFPNFNYNAFAGETFDHQNVFQHMGRKSFTTMLNTANYFFHRDTWLACWDPNVNPHTADSIYQNYRWLAAGNSLYVVPGLQYFHRVHDGSHYKRENHKTGNFAQQIENKLKALR